MTNTTLSRAAALLATAVIIAACGSDDDAQPAGTTAADTSPTTADTQAEATEPPPVASEAPATSDDVDCGTISVAMNDSPQNRAVSYAIDEGIISSDEVDVEVVGLPIPALIEEAQSFTNHDIVEAAINGISFGINNGAPLIVLGPGQVGKGTDGESGALFAFVESGSDVAGPADLAGSNIATVAIGAATTQMMGIVLDNEGINPAIEGGDVTWQELPYDQMPVALASGDVDYIISSHGAAFQSFQDPNLQFAGVIDDAYREISGGQPPVLTVLATIAPKVEGREACFDAARALIAESYDYALDNISDVALAVANNYEGGDPAVLEPFITTWITEWFDYPADPTAADIEAMQTQIDLGVAAGMNPPVDMASITLPTDG